MNPLQDGRFWVGLLMGMALLVLAKAAFPDLGPVQNAALGLVCGFVGITLMMR